MIFDSLDEEPQKCLFAPSGQQPNVFFLAETAKSSKLEICQLLVSGINLRLDRFEMFTRKSKSSQSDSSFHTNKTSP